MSEVALVIRLGSMKDNKTNKPNLGVAISLRQHQIDTDCWGWEVEFTTVLAHTVWNGFMPDVVIRNLHTLTGEGLNVTQAIEHACLEFPLILNHEDEWEFKEAINRLKESIGSYDRFSDTQPHSCGTHRDFIPITGTDASVIESVLL